MPLRHTQHPLYRLSQRAVYGLALLATHSMKLNRFEISIAWFSRRGGPMIASPDFLAALPPDTRRLEESAFANRSLRGAAQRISLGTSHPGSYARCRESSSSLKHATAPAEFLAECAIFVLARDV
jgi:hypothetical protein